MIRRRAAPDEIFKIHEAASKACGRSRASNRRGRPLFALTTEERRNQDAVDDALKAAEAAAEIRLAGRARSS